MGYEGLGALAGGILLIIAPDGGLMDMPVDMMHGVFRDFLIPGIILFALGILNSFAFVSVLRRTSIDWLMSGLALGGLAIWFVVEIIILQELHWLHLMWGFPVFLGIVVAIPFIAARFDRATMVKAFLVSGILSTLWYVAVNIYVPLQDAAYSFVTQVVSELSAIGAPTRVLWVLLCLPYSVLYAAFGWGVLQSASGNRSLRIAGIIIIVASLFNFFWPPMQMRGNEMALTDVLHITWAMVWLLSTVVIMGLGAAALGRRFRIYTIVTFVIFIVFGILIGTESPGVAQNLPTPYIGIWERINMGVFFLWVVVFAIALLKKK